MLRHASTAAEKLFGLKITRTSADSATRRARPLGDKDDKPTNPYILLLCLFGILLLLLMTAYPFLGVSSYDEDAVILFHYSRNLAQTGIISYNASGPRTEGATDFLWMVYIAIGMRLHIAPAISVGIANVFSLIGIAIVLLRLASRERQRPAVLAILGAAAFLPQMLAALVGFSVLPFSFALSLTFLFCEERRNAAAALSALFLCLLRPDGVVFAIPLLVRSLLLAPSTRRIGVYSSLFVLPGIAYFLWRWSYFGRLFPLPFLVKSDAHRILGLFEKSNVIIFPYIGFTLIVVLCALGRRAWQARAAGMLLALCIVPTLFYVWMRLDQNLADRFFAYLPLSVALILAAHWDNLRISRRRLGIITCIAYLFFLARPERTAIATTSMIRDTDHRLWRIGTAMSKLPQHGTILITEAGIVPYTSGWTSFDSWGLNTAPFASHLVTPEDIVRLHPDVIMFHSPSCEVQVHAIHTHRTWGHMVENIETAVARTGEYVIWRTPLPVSNATRVLLWPHPVKSDEWCWCLLKSSESRAMESILQQNGGLAEPSGGVTKKTGSE